MKQFSLLVCLAFSLWSCNTGNSDSAAETPESDVDAARMFIRNALDGDYKKARKLLLPDSSNVQLLDNIERSYLHSVTAMDQRAYRESSIHIHETKKLGDSASVIVYSNSFKNEKDSVKAVRVGKDWLIDLKYSFPQTRITQ